MRSVRATGSSYSWSRLPSSSLSTSSWLLYVDSSWYAGLVLVGFGVIWLVEAGIGLDEDASRETGFEVCTGLVEDDIRLIDCGGFSGGGDVE